MILGFSHLTFGTRNFDQAMRNFQSMGFVPTSIYRSVRSAPAKWPLMTQPAQKHDLALLKRSLTVEIVSHDTGSVDRPPVLDFDSTAGDIMLRVQDARRELDFLEKVLPCTRAGDRIAIHGAFPTWSARLRLVEDRSGPHSQPLDIEGYSSLAFYSNNIEEDVRCFVELGAGNATEEFFVELNGRRIGVAMLRSPGGVILELLRINRQ